MKKDLHPAYYPNAKVKCVCGASFTVGSTKQELRVEVCSKCHPFYTGARTLVDTEGRVQRFTSRRTKAETIPKMVKKERVKKGTKKAVK